MEEQSPTNEPLYLLSKAVEEGDPLATKKINNLTIFYTLLCFIGVGVTLL